MKFLDKYYSDWALTNDKEVIKLSPTKAVDYYKVKVTKSNKTKVLFLTPEGELIKERYH